jgi:hypothetical protein
MKIRKTAIATVAAATVAVTIGVGTALTGDAPPWLEALNARSEGLNRQYGLGEYAQSEMRATEPTPAWLRALMIRSEALNQQYGLGTYARKPSATEPTPAWLRALMIRSEALNQQYGLGEYAPGS